jgi:hypothetical protein
MQNQRGRHGSPENNRLLSPLYFLLPQSTWAALAAALHFASCANVSDYNGSRRSGRRVARWEPSKRLRCPGQDRGGIRSTDLGEMCGQDNKQLSHYRSTPGIRWTKYLARLNCCAVVLTGRAGSTTRSTVSRNGGARPFSSHTWLTRWCRRYDDSQIGAPAAQLKTGRGTNF